MKTIKEVKENLPLGINKVNMEHDGRRSCFMREYGSVFTEDKHQQAVINNIIQAWGATTSFDIDKHLNGRPGVCNRDQRRYLMLRFTDGLWRHAGFGGISGEPMASCDWQGFPGKTGEEGYLNYKIFWQKKHVTDAMEKLEMERTKLDQLETALAKVKDK